MHAVVDEAFVEQAALEWFADLGYTTAHALTPDAEAPNAERRTYAEVVLRARLRAAIARLNPRLPAAVLDEAERRILHPDGPGLVAQNRHAHALLVDGVPVQVTLPDSTIGGETVRLADFDYPERNDWLVANQVTLREGGHERRPDLIVFLNGLPVAVIELKNPLDENATLHGAYNQLQTYKAEFPALFAHNEILIVADGKEARAGTLTADWARFMPWKTIDGAATAPGVWELEVLIKGMFARGRFLDLLAHFIVFEADGPEVSKKLAAYHQYHAVNKAIEATVAAASPEGDRKAGVIWHTQGSGKSLTMIFYAGKMARDSAMENPTLVVLTDRNDLDDQLFAAFAACRDLLRQTPVQAESREHLRDLLHRASGGIIFTTIQKFLPPDGDPRVALSERRNIVFIADEAHRSQYGLKARLVRGGDGADPYLAYGLASHMRAALPNASYIGFTGTPIETADRSTRHIFGDYIDIYDIQQAVEDGATVRIEYEARLARLALDEAERPTIDPEFEELTEGEEIAQKNRLASKWAQLEKLVGAPRRIELLAADLVLHAEARLSVLEGKVLIVCMSRRICVDLYNAIITIRPDWHDERLEAGAIKVVMTGDATDPPAMQPHIHAKAAARALARRFKDPADPLTFVIVRDMWLTGFDVPSLHTMYLDKPMKGHGLMQAIARVNRVFKDKPGGLVVDYLGLAEQLRAALADYTERDRREAVLDQGQVLATLREKLGVVRAILHGCDYAGFFVGSPATRLAILAAVDDFVVATEERKRRFIDGVTALTRAFALAMPAEEAVALRDEIAFFQAIKSSLLKLTATRAEQKAALDSAINQLISRVVVSDEVVDIFAAAGLRKPEISILSDEFLAEVRDLPRRNLALELLRKLLNDEIRARSARNVVQARRFSEQLEAAIRRYQSRGIEAAQVIQELVDLAKEMRESAQRGERLGLSDDELAFYDALGANESAVQVLGDEMLRAIARELVETVRRNVTIDWTVKESVRARLRVTIKRLLRKYQYPPDRQEQAVTTILEQSETLCLHWDL